MRAITVAWRLHPDADSQMKPCLIGSNRGVDRIRKMGLHLRRAGDSGEVQIETGEHLFGHLFIQRLTEKAQETRRCHQHQAIEIMGIVVNMEVLGQLMGKALGLLVMGIGGRFHAVSMVPLGINGSPGPIGQEFMIL
jgi:hypothetical protein